MDPCSRSKSSHRRPRKSAKKSKIEDLRAGLLKKVAELSTLCGVKACVIVYSGDDTVPVTWPEDPSAVVDVIREYKRKRGDFECEQLRQRSAKRRNNISEIRRKRQHLLEIKKAAPPPPTNINPSPPLLDPSPQLLDPSPQLLDPSPQLMDPSPFIGLSPLSCPRFKAAPSPSPPLLSPPSSPSSSPLQWAFMRDGLF